MSDEASEWYKDQGHIRAIFDLAICSGIIMKPPVDAVDPSAAVAVSILATPSYFPKELFVHAEDIQPGLNSLIDTVSRQHDFIAGALEKVLETDIFTKRLFDIYNQIRHDNKQTCVLGIHRCDYMLDWRETDGLALRQIEMNTISCGMMGLNAGLKSFHEYVCSRYARKDIDIPHNSCLTSTVDAIAMAWKEYDKKDAIVLFVSEANELNMFDQRPIEFHLWRRYSIKSIRKTLGEIYHEASLGPDRELIISEVQCAVVYFRAGYSPFHYPTEKEWQARLLIERSTASCSPSVAYQLVGTKKMQQCLAEAGVLERFVSDLKMVAKIRSTFAGLYTLDKNPEGDRTIEMALGGPEKFVMKPQREGGGNNFYGDAIREKLEEIRETSEREGYILMDRIRPPPQEGLILKPRSLELELGRVNSELGIYGMFVRRGEKVLLNSSAGYLLRTKLISVNEGGVSVGAASLDSPSLLTMEEFITRVIQ